MALWNTFHWSDGTLWADANGLSGGRTAFIDRSGYQVSLKLTHTNDTHPGSLSSLIIQSMSAELGIRPQLPSGYEAFIDRNDNTQRISVRITHTSNPETELATEDDEVIITEDDESIIIDVTQPLAIDHVHMLVNPRSRSQPTA